MSELAYGVLIDELERGQVGSEVYELAKTKLTIANMEVQADASKQLVTSTDELVKATKALGRFTLALVVSTVLLAVVTAVALFWRP